MRMRTIARIVFSLAALLTMQPKPTWAAEEAVGTGATDVTVRGTTTDVAVDTNDNQDEGSSQPLDQTGTSHLPTILLTGGILCGGGAIALRGRKHAADGSDDPRC